MSTRDDRVSKRRAAGRGGFTLIEILVVVAIIALLIAILIPSLAKARWQTKRIACSAHIHDLGTAFMMYAHGHKGDYYPITANSGLDTYWSLYRARMLPDPKILICPATKNVIRPQTLSNPTTTVNSSENGKPIPMGTSDIDRVARGAEDNSGGHSYEYNGCYDGGTGGLANYHKRASHFKQPHRMMLVHDGDDEVNGAAGCIDSHFGNGNNCPQPWDNHGETGMNMLFGDGHSEWVKKLQGSYLNVTVTPHQMRTSGNASIETIWMRSQYPWKFGKP